MTAAPVAFGPEPYTTDPKKNNTVKTNLFDDIILFLFVSFTMGSQKLSDSVRQLRKSVQRDPSEKSVASNTSKKKTVEYCNHNTSVPLLHRSTLSAIPVLVLAIVTAIGWNHVHEQRTHSKSKQAVFLRNFCSKGYCADLKSQRTTLNQSTTIAQSTFQPKSTVLTVPRQLQLWDVDALQNLQIQDVLEKMQTRDATNKVSNAAVLALHLTLLRKQQQLSRMDPLLTEYIHHLPTFDELLYHPVLWEASDLRRLLSSTTALETTLAFQRLYEREYQCFRKYITMERIDYLASRLAVTTRAFGTKNSRNASFAMVPILDSFNHDSVEPNVDYSVTEDGTFSVTAISTIKAGAELYDSYGKRTDVDLFARYGFVRGDGRDSTQASIAVWHTPKLIQDDHTDDDHDDHDSVKRLALMLRYLQYDDGYENCVHPTYDKEAFELKRLKYKYVLERATSTKHWVVTMAAKSVSPTKLLPSLSDLQFNGTTLFSTCRLLSLTHQDYDGNATDLLRENLNNIGYILPATHDALEFRTLICIARMASTMMDRFGVTMDAQMAIVQKAEKHSKEWMAAHLKLSEMQTLFALKQAAFGKIRQQFGEHMLGSQTAFTMRNEPCSKERMRPLLDYAMADHNVKALL
jgi:hypothetical protein